jgi:CHAT domain-containing protein
MNALTARLDGGADTAESVRAATRALLRTLRQEHPAEAQPAFWGAFLAVGDWR